MTVAHIHQNWGVLATQELINYNVIAVGLATGLPARSVFCFCRMTKSPDLWKGPVHVNLSTGVFNLVDLMCRPLNRYVFIQIRLIARAPFL